MEKVKVGLKLDKDAVVPSYAIRDDACMDLTAISVEYDPEIDCYIYHTGIHVEIPEGYEIEVKPRSSNRKTDCYLCNAPGTVDCGYTGEILVCYKNRTSYAIRTEMKYLWEAMDNPPHAARRYREYEDEAKKGDIDLEYAPYKVGEKVAQIKIIQCPRIEWELKYEFKRTERGDGSFGHTDNLEKK